MEQFETGMMARSKSGHDAGKVYVITKVEEAYVYLVDGKVRTLDKPKKKKKKHVQLIKETPISFIRIKKGRIFLSHR